jgi:hypothetical protein
MPVHRQSLSLPAGGADFVIVDGDAKAGFYPYKADMLLPAAVSATTRGKAGARRTIRKATAPKALRRVAVKGGSSPKIIIDT